MRNMHIIFSICWSVSWSKAAIRTAYRKSIYLEYINNLQRIKVYLLNFFKLVNCRFLTKLNLLVKKIFTKTQHKSTHFRYNSKKLSNIWQRRRLLSWCFASETAEKKRWLSFLTIVSAVYEAVILICPPLVGMQGSVYSPFSQLSNWSGHLRTAIMF